MRRCIFGLLLLCFGALTFAATISMVPAIVSFDFIPPGYTFNMGEKVGTKIMIPNENDFAVLYEIKLEACKKAASLLPGYENFPDIKWCQLEPETITVMPNDTGEINLTFRIPADSVYFNQLWELGVIVQSIKGIQMSAGAVNFGLFPSVRGSFLISTTPNKVANPKGKGTGVVPATEWLDIEKAIKGEEIFFEIYNNDTVAHDYKIEPYEFPHFELYEVRLAIQPTGDNESGETYWLKTARGFLFFKNNTVHIEPGQSAEWSAKVKLPNKKEIREAPGWDLVVKILPDGKEEHSGLFRIVVVKK